MVHYQRQHQASKGEHLLGGDEVSQNLVIDCGNSGFYKRRRPRSVFLLLLSLFSCSFILAHLLGSSSAFAYLYSSHVDVEIEESVVTDAKDASCSFAPEGTICCDRRSHRSDVCFMKGDVRTNSKASSVFLYPSRNSNGFCNTTSSIIAENKASSVGLQHEKIKPYTRKWETSIMDTIDELHLISKGEELSEDHKCDVDHDVPAVFFSTGGYTGNLYHEFNDGILPLYVTSQHFKRKVVFVILEYHKWWIMKYENVLSRLSDYPVIDFNGDDRTHCFPLAIVGLQIHDELTINPSLMKENKSIRDFRNLLDQAYRPRIKGLIKHERKSTETQKKISSLSPTSESNLESQRKQELKLKQPKLVIISRKRSREILNEKSIVEMTKKIGFSVRVIRPDRTTELAKVYYELNSSDVMVGVHGAAMTHFLFMRPGSVFIQIVPLGTTWAAEAYYGEPAKKLGLVYTPYQILPKESSLYKEYDKNDPVLINPGSVTKKGWEFTKKVYLDKQNVRINLRRFRKQLVLAYKYSIAAGNRDHDFQFTSVAS